MGKFGFFSFLSLSKSSPNHIHKDPTILLEDKGQLLSCQLGYAKGNEGSYTFTCPLSNAHCCFKSTSELI